MASILHTTDSAAGPDFSAVLTPHRSLGRAGFAWLMLFVGAISGAAGAMFAVVGAWPVMGFFGLDVLLLGGAFLLNYRAARAFERITLDVDGLVLTKVTASGRAQSWSFNPFWTKLHVEEHPSEAATLWLVSHGRRLTLGECLSHAEKRDFAAHLAAALADWRGPRI